MTFVKTLAVGTFLASALIATGAVAKGHNQGFGNQTAGQMTAGLVDNGQRNSPDVRDGLSARESAYGIRDQRADAMDEMKGNSDAARTKDANHPSMQMR